jgi:anti-sigma B factor antagonist
MDGQAARIVVSEADGTRTLALIGELDYATAPTIERELTAHSNTSLRVDLDLAGLEFVDAAGLRALIAVFRNAPQRGPRLEVRRPLPRSLRRLVALTGVGRELGV